MVNMLKSKTFVKKTRSGGVMKIVREHYLRDDIWCGSEYCTDCKQESTVLQRDACIESNLCSFPHYVIPDTNVVLHQVKSSSIDPLKCIYYLLSRILSSHFYLKLVSFLDKRLKIRATKIPTKSPCISYLSRTAFLWSVVKRSTL